MPSSWEMQTQTMLKTPGEKVDKPTANEPTISFFVTIFLI